MALPGQFGGEPADVDLAVGRIAEYPVPGERDTAAHSTHGYG